MSKLLLLGALCATFVGLGACEREGRAERAGEAIDDAADEVRDRAENVRDEAEELVEDARGE